MAYVFQEFPKWVTLSNGDKVIVDSDEERAQCEAALRPTLKVKQVKGAK